MTRNTLALIACSLIAPAAAAAQTGGLTKVQVYALQQELKNQCGLTYATGVMDGPTRHAIAVCNKKYGTQGNGAGLLAAMNIGFSPGDMAPQGMGSVMGNSGNTTTVITDTTVTTTTTRGAVRSTARSTARSGRRTKRMTTKTTKKDTTTTPAKKY